MMRQFIDKNWLYLIGGAVGGIGGYLYYYFVGCNSGTCPITSSPMLSIIWGALMGGLIFGMFKKKEKANE